MKLQNIKQINKKEKLEALYKDYDNRIREIRQLTTLYHRNVGFIQSYLTILATLAIYVYVKDIKFFNDALKGEHHLEIIFILSFLTSFIFFLHSTMLDTLYMLMSNGKYVVVIEKRINRILSNPILGWENKVIPFILGDKWWIVNGFIRPQFLVFIYTSILFIFSIISLCFFSYKYTGNYSIIYIAITTFVSLFQLWQWIKLIFVGDKFLKNSILNLFNFEKLQKWDTDIIKYIIPPITIILGFFIFFIASLKTNTFLPSKDHLFALIAIPSIWIGDLFILPLLNLKIYNLLRIYNISFLKKISIIMIIISFSIMSYIHYLWTQDNYTGFMDIKKGELSFAGWWHLIFSSIELGAIFVVIYFYLKNYKQNNKFLKKNFIVFSKYLLIFTSISIIDFLMRPILFLEFKYNINIISNLHFYIQELSKQFYQSYTEFFPFVLSVILFLIVKYRQT